MCSIVSILTVVNVMNRLAESTKYGFYKFSQLYTDGYEWDNRGIIYDDENVDEDGFCEIVLDMCGDDIVTIWTDTLSNVCGGYVSVKLRVREEQSVPAAGNELGQIGTPLMVDLTEDLMEIIVDFEYVDEDVVFSISRGAWDVNSDCLCLVPPMP